MEEIIPTNEYTVVDDIAYVNPQVALDEGNKFIDNYRAAQAENTAKIASDTQKLGTDVPSSQGGLVGGGSYFTSRNQTPQTNAAISDIRATIQAKALNDVLENEQTYWKQKYSDAYKSAQKRASSSSGSGSSGSDSIGEVETVASDENISTGSASGSVSATDGERVVVSPDGVVHVETGDWLNGNGKMTDIKSTSAGKSVAGAIEMAKKLISGKTTSPYGEFYNADGTPKITGSK